MGLGLGLSLQVMGTLGCCFFFFFFFGVDGRLWVGGGSVRCV